jgi:bacterioferritin-associated ferredoxin
MIVCVCHRVSDSDIARAAMAGCLSFEALQNELRVGTACGTCTEHARVALALHASAAQRRATPGTAACGGPSVGAMP